MNYNYSIIIPHKNIPELLLRCLYSIPDREDVQIIVVDDNSDGSDTYLAKYPELSRPNVEFYPTKEGKGAGYARNVGLQHAKGEWVLFSDSDDYYFTEKLNTLFELAPSITSNVVIFGVKTIALDKETSSDYKEDFDGISPVEDFGKLLRRFEAWRKMVRRRFIEEQHLRFEEVAVSNDVRFHVRLMSLLSKEDIALFNSNVYCWVHRKGSIIHSINPSNEICRLNVSLRINRFTHRQGWGYLDGSNEYLWRIKQVSRFQFYVYFIKECLYLGLVKSIDDFAYSCRRDKECLNLFMRFLSYIASKLR